MGLVISLCDYTGNMVRPWREAGHDCVIVDVKHPAGKSTIPPHNPRERPLIVIGHRVEELRNSFSSSRLSEAIVFAMPPCTDVAVSGALHFKAKGLQALIRSLTTLEACVHLAEQSLAWMLENPVSTFSTYWRKPDYTFNPFEFASQSDNFAEEMYPKRTCLWTGGKFVMPKGDDRFVCDPLKIRDMGSAGQDERSITPLGFSYAVFEANKHLIET